MLQVRAINGPTGRLLEEMLRERHLLGGDIKGIINYGYTGNDSNLPTLNEKAGKQNKLEELRVMAKAGISTVPFATDMRQLKPPLFGRKLQHTRGRDIQIYQVRNGGGSDYYTQLIPKAKEVRLWVFRNKAIATYEKVLTYANKLGRRGRSKEVWNWANGYAYEFVRPEEVSDKLKTLAVDSVTSVGLDFGAVDIIIGEDRKYYVLECNSAPGVEGRRQGLISLVNCIERWAKNGFKERT